MKARLPLHHDPAIVGRNIKIDGEDFTVVGIMPHDFAWQFWSGPRDLWVPVGYTKTDYARGSNSFLSIGRLKPGVTLARARSELAAVAMRIAKQYRVDDPGVSATADPLGEYGLQALRHTMLTLLAAVSLVLLIACVNVANLMLARGASRQKEIAIRRALGFDPARQSSVARTDVLGLVLRSSMKWVLAGLIFGFAGSIGIAHVLGTLLYGVRPTDPAVLGTVSVLLAGVALAASFVPARRAANLDPAQTLRHE